MVTWINQFKELVTSVKLWKVLFRLETYEKKISLKFWRYIKKHSWLFQRFEAKWESKKILLLIIPFWLKKPSLV